MTFSEIADRYAREIAQAKDDCLAKSEAGTKIAAAARANFRETVLEVLEHVDSLQVRHKPITGQDVDRILRELDARLQVRPGTMEMLKKGSIEMSVEFDRYLQTLFESIEYYS